MLHLLSKPAARGLRPASPPGTSDQCTSVPVIITEQEVVFNTAAATLVPAATIRPRWRGATLIAAIGRIHLGMPQPQPHCPRHDAGYFENARMSRQMDHL
jgi:hypothetical protein